MNDIEKIAAVAEALGESANSLTLDTALVSLKDWDSMGKLSLIILFDSELGKALSVEQIKSFKTIGDIVKAME